ncbi:hypothetical protein ACFL7M_12745 [Thermodesulfobacteriota bacterium]
MKHFPYRTLFLSIFLPPIFYLLTLMVLEDLFQRQQTTKFNKIIIKNHEALLEGRYIIKEEINRNIGEYFGKSLLHSFGINTQIIVKTSDDKILYPARFQTESGGSLPDEDFTTLPNSSLNYLEVAAQNYEILNKGLVLLIGVRIKHNGWLSNSILIFYVFISVIILHRIIKKRQIDIERYELEMEKLTRQLSEQLTKAESRLKQVVEKEGNYIRKIDELGKDKQALSKDIDGLFEEMEKMEEGLTAQRDLKEETESEVLGLKEELDHLKAHLGKSKKKKKKIIMISKRFRVLYKNLLFTDRALQGFMSLSDELQLKAEEIIHKLNEHSHDTADFPVSVKRKVFGKGGKKNILEVDFSYAGRLYFKKDSGRKTEIVSIGTKNTQDQDLAFMEKIG